MNIPMVRHRRRQCGSTLIGFVAGLVLGIVIALAVALVITKSPIPFVNKVGRAPQPASGPEPAKLPDPNKSLYPKVEPKEAPATASQPAAPDTAKATTSGADAKGGAPVIDKSSAAPGESVEIRQSFLQAGAFKSADDAENMKAKLALLGLEARVTQTDRDGAVLYRVRVGPYGRSDDLDRVRQRLSENGIQPTVVPVGR